MRLVDDRRVSGIIVEAEAYTGHDDLASHGRLKKTKRNLPMWGPPGYAYIYLTYGMYWLLNAVCEPTDQPAAALIRAIEPLEGLDIMAANRVGRPQLEWTSGPARLTMALGLDSRHNQVDMTDTTSNLWIETGDPIPDSAVSAGPRIGMGKKVMEPWFSMPWRWWITDNVYVSK